MSDKKWSKLQAFAADYIIKMLLKRDAKYETYDVIECYMGSHNDPRLRNCYQQYSDLGWNKQLREMMCYSDQWDIITIQPNKNVRYYCTQLRYIERFEKREHQLMMMNILNITYKPKILIDMITKGTLRQRSRRMDKLICQVNVYANGDTPNLGHLNKAVCNFVRSSAKRYRQVHNYILKYDESQISQWIAVEGHFHKMFNLSDLNTPLLITKPVQETDTLLEEIKIYAVDFYLKTTALHIVFDHICYCDDETKPLKERVNLRNAYEVREMAVNRLDEVNQMLETALTTSHTHNRCKQSPSCCKQLTHEEWQRLLSFSYTLFTFSQIHRINRDVFLAVYDNRAVLSAQTLLELEELSKSYNIEWALALFDWEGKGNQQKTVERYPRDFLKRVCHR